jgi:hypothetical protein
MIRSIAEELRAVGAPEKGLQLPDVRVDPARIRCIMINEAPPQDAREGFYAGGEGRDMRTVRALFQAAGVEIADHEELLARGIYLTCAVKRAKTEYAVPAKWIDAHLPLLECELSLFPNLRAIMLMGDVAKKALNILAKRRTGKPAIPSGATYKIRERAFYYGDARVFPSYTMTGANILIEKSKQRMVADDIRRMLEMLNN